MHKFFMERSASLWTAAFCIVAGVILVLYPVAVSNMFVTALAIGALVYGLIHLFRYIQGRRAGISLTGDLFLTVVAGGFALFALVSPQSILAILPLALGCMLLVDCVGKLPLAVAAFRGGYPGRGLFVLSAMLPGLLGLVILINPFSTARLMVVAFGVSLIVDGMGELMTVLLQKRRKD